MWRECYFISCVLLLVDISVGVQNGDVRLVGGQSSNEGRVEVYYSGEWGTVCDDNWDIAEAKVVCRHLNFPGVVSAVAGGVYGQGYGEIWLDDVNCKGTEKHMSQCDFEGWGDSDCDHGQDAGVVCEKASAQNVSREYAVSHNVLPELLGELFDSGRDCDLGVSMVVDNSTVETICTHKLILSLTPGTSFSSSSSSSVNDSSLSINVSSDCRPYVTTFVRYLYTRQINITVSSAQCIHKMAVDWGLQQLQEDAGKFFPWLLTEDATFQTQSSLYEYSVSTGDKALQKTCLRYLAWNCQALIRSPAWTGLPRATVKALLFRSDLVVPDEAFVLKGLESWEAAQGGPSNLDLLRYIRFPMISAEDLHRLKGVRYQAGKLQGFQFNSLPIGPLFGELMSSQWRLYTPRIYTGDPWSFLFSLQEVNHVKHHGYFIHKGTHYNSLSATFRTPVHTSAYFTLFRDMGWSTSVFTRNDQCSDGVTCPAAVLEPQNNNQDLPVEFRNSLVYQNKVVLLCEGEYVVHVQDFKPLNNQDMALMPANSSAGQAYPCHSEEISYRVVVRPKYTTGLKFTEEEAEEVVDEEEEA